MNPRRPRIAARPPARVRLRLPRDREASRPERVRARDVVGEAVAGVAARPGRSALTALGTVLGVGTLVVTLGLAATATAQVNQRFDAIAATEVVLTDTRPTPADPLPLPPDIGTRITALDGVESAGLLWKSDVAPVFSTVPGGPTGSARTNPTRTPVFAVTTGAQQVLAPRLARGRLFAAGDDAVRARVAVIGRPVARSLGIEHTELPRTIYLDGVPFDVVGIYDDVQRHGETLLGALVPQRTALALWGPPADGAALIISTRLGAATVVAREAPYAALPRDPARMSSATAPDPTLLRGQIGSDLAGAFVLLAGIGLVLGMIGIANTTLVSVLERVSEIGLRRALGAQRRSVAAQFVLESGLTGSLGGVVGSCAGTAVVVAVAVSRGWTPVVSVPLVLAAAACGTVTGLLAGIYPAWRASRLTPVDALVR